jgi:hypothetical protein
MDNRLSVGVLALRIINRLTVNPVNMEIGATWEGLGSEAPVQLAASPPSTCRSYCEVRRGLLRVQVAPRQEMPNLVDLSIVAASARGRARMRRPYVSRNQHPRVPHLFLHLQWLLHVRPAAAVPVLPGGVAWPFRPFSLSFSSSGAGFSPFWVGASV